MGIPVKLPAFEGPLDLLLHLIESNKIDIYGPYLIEREPHCFQFTEEPKYVALTGVSRAVKEGEKISGVSA